MGFSCFDHSKYHQSITPPFHVCFFLRSFILSIYLLPADISEESSPHGSSTPYDWETLKLFKFYLTKNLKGMEEISYHYSIFGS